MGNAAEGSGGKNKSMEGGGMMESLENCEHDWVKAKRTPSKYRRWFCKNCGTVYTFTGELDDELREKNLTKSSGGKN